MRIAVRPLDSRRTASAAAPHVLWQVADISGERGGEAAAGARLRSVLAQFEDGPVGLILANEDGAIAHMNTTFARWLGRTPAAADQNPTLSDILPGDDLARLHSLLQEPSVVPAGIDVDVAAEGHSPFRVVRADLFILSLLASTTLGLVWAAAGGGAGILFGLYIIATTVLFGSVPWSKFAHMFFKPAAAFEKRMAAANGTAQNLPTQTRDDPEQRKRHSMELLRDAPMDMGLGIKREAPRHY